MTLPFDCLIIGGPTASGKTALSIEIAKRFNGEIISADSMQIYRGMDIGTAKPTEEEKQGIPHHLMDFLDIAQKFSAAEYKEKATTAIVDVLSRGSLPIVTGGTGLYIDALLYNTKFGKYDVSPGLRDSLQKEAAAYGNQAMLDQLFQVDPETAAVLHPSNLRRILRALEVYRATGKPISQFKKESHQTPPPFGYRLWVTTYQNRQTLYNRIDYRVDDMIKNGLMEETHKLLSQGLDQNPTASQAIGYKEFKEYFAGKMGLDEAIALLKQRSRQYVKRQITWFKRYEQACFIPMDQGMPLWNVLKNLLR